MPKKALEALTESMFYVLMALRSSPMCGTDISHRVTALTDGRLQMGPATLYTILGKFEAEGYIAETAVEGRRRTYAITDRGKALFRGELSRLKLCVADGQRELDRQLALDAPAEPTKLLII